MRRSVSGMNDDRMLSNVVLPEPVPPETRMFRRARTHERKKVMSSGLDERNRLTTSACPHFSLANFRIVRQGPLSAIGGEATLAHEPCLGRASHIGVDSAARRPPRPDKWSMTCRIWTS